MRSFKFGIKTLSLLLAAVLVFGNLSAVSAEDDSAAEQAIVLEAADTQTEADSAVGTDLSDIEADADSAVGTDLSDIEADTDSAVGTDLSDIEADTDPADETELSDTDAADKDQQADETAEEEAQTEEESAGTASEEEDASGTAAEEAADASAEPGEAAPAAAEETADTEEQEEQTDETVLPENEETVEDSVKAAGAGMAGKILTETNPVNGRYTVKVSGFKSSEAVEKLRVEVWSSTNGKDDLVQGDMKAGPSGTAFTFNSYIKDFNDYGTISANVYAVKADGTEELFGETSFTISAPAAKKTTTKYNTKTGNFAVTVTGFSSEFTVTRVRAAIWCEGHKSDKKWYTMEQSSASKYVLTGANIDEFKSYSGTYQAAVYAYVKNGKAVNIGSAAFTVEPSGGVVSYVDKNAGTTGEEQKTYTLKVSGIARPDGVSAVQFKVWPTADTSVKKWYTPVQKTGYYVKSVNISSFKRGGQYKMQVYVTDTNGTTKCVRSKNVMNVDGMVGGKVVITESDPAGKFTVALQNSSSPSGLESVKFAIWTQSDKSDKRTLIGKKQSDGSFTAAVNISKLDYNTGTYHVVAKTVMGNGVSKNRKQANVKYTTADDFMFVIKPETGKRTIGIINPSATDNVRFAVWSETNGQDDLQWVSGKKSGKKWTASLNLEEFDDPGTFQVHAYSGDTYLASKTFKAATGEAGKTGWYYELGLKYYYKAGQKLTDLTGMVSGPYQICVNRQCNTITVYALDGSNGYIVPVIAFACSTGLPGMETPTGVYYTYAKNRWEELMGPSWGQYSARVVDGIYIHSVPSNIPNSHYGIAWTEYNKLGSAASHGCIRVNVRDAKWIYDHCGVGTQVKIYDSSDPGPFGKPATIKIAEGQDWDPTDPEI